MITTIMIMHSATIISRLHNHLHFNHTHLTYFLTHSRLMPSKLHMLQ